MAWLCLCWAQLSVLPVTALKYTRATLTPASPSPVDFSHRNLLDSRPIVFAFSGGVAYVTLLVLTTVQLAAGVSAPKLQTGPYLPWSAETQCSSTGALNWHL